MHNPKQFFWHLCKAFKVPQPYFLSNHVPTLLLVHPCRNPTACPSTHVPTLLLVHPHPNPTILTPTWQHSPLPSRNCHQFTSSHLEGTEGSTANLQGNTAPELSPRCAGPISTNHNTSHLFCFCTATETNASFAVCVNNDKCLNSLNQLCIAIQSVHLA